MDKRPDDKFEFAEAHSSDFDYEKFLIEEAAANKDTKPEKKLKLSRSKSEGTSELYDWMQSLVSALLVCVLVFAFLVRIIGIIGSSMEPSFSNGDSVVISNLFYTPKQGDIIVLRKLAFQEEPIIKRIIAVEGQTVDIDFEKGIVYVDDQPLSELYVADLTLTPIDFDGKITVPNNCIFVMGDNRNNSTDSRSSQIGCVDVRYVMGKVLLRLLPINEFGTVN